MDLQQKITSRHITTSYLSINAGTSFNFNLSEEVVIRHDVDTEITKVNIDYWLGHFLPFLDKMNEVDVRHYH